MTKPITINVVKNLKPQSILWDSKISGFGIRRQKSEARVYVLKTRINGRQRWFTIGRHGSPWTPESARREAMRLLVLIASGEDPYAIFSDDRSVILVSELCKCYLADIARNNVLTKFGVPKKPSTIATDRGRIERHIIPLLGNIRVRDLTGADIRKFMHDVTKGKTAVNIKTQRSGRSIVTGGRGTASRTVGLLGGILSYAIDREIISSNPVAGIKRFPDHKEERYLSLDELARINSAIDQLIAEGANLFALAGIRLLMFTGCRKSEILTLRWHEIDFENQCLRLPDSKTGQRVIPLANAAIELLTTIPRIRSNPFVIPSDKSGSHMVDLRHVWVKVRDRADLNWATMNHLRHSFASIGANSGLGLPIIGKILGHKNPSTTQRYAKIANDPAMDAAELISETITSALKLNSNRS